MHTEPVVTTKDIDGVLDATSMRTRHRKMMLELVWQEREASRADLARRTGLSRSTVSAIITDLLETGLVREARTGASTGGRRPIVLEFRDDAAYLVGVELGASHVSAVLTDLHCAVLDDRDVPCPVRDEPELALEVVERSIAELLAGRGGASARLVGIGVAAPSPIDPRRPGELAGSVVPAWQGYDLRKRLRKRFERPVLVDNDANLGALAELRWGAGRRAGDLAYLKVATGVGAGLILDGHIFRGAGGVAGEIGHISIDQKGPMCMCGLRGCLTTLVGTQALFGRVRDLGPQYPESPLHAAPLTVDGLVDAALAGDALARRVVAYAGETLGIGVANLLNVVNPARVIVGGGITRAGELLLGPLRDTVTTRALAESMAHAEIERSSLGERAIAIGAATLVLEAALDDLSLFPSRLRESTNA